MKTNYLKLYDSIEISDLNKFHYPNQKNGVIIIIEDKNGNFLLQQRGLQAQDEIGLYEAVGGKIEKTDQSLKKAIIREIYEEMGSEVNIEISDPIAIYHLYKNSTNWIFAIFHGKYISGKIKIMEPEKCINYHFFTYEEIMNSKLVTDGLKILLKNMKSEL